MANYVLVHGAWGGGQTYDKTVPDLRKAGHEVLVATLRGLGTRQAELHPGITLSNHIEDVCAQVKRSSFGRFILVGHSYGGMVITGVAARLGKRIDAICYIDAFLPEDGQSLWDITGEFEHDWYIDRQKFNPGMVPMIGAEEFEPVPGVIGYHPLLTLLEAVRLTGDEAAIPRKSYILATGYEPTPFPPFAAKVKDDPAWEYHETDCSHLVMDDRPELTREVLLGLAS
jgi:pimeloyl-ACP methyl ester carboxylesterase